MLVNEIDINHVYTRLCVYRLYLYLFYLIVYLKHNMDALSKKKCYLKTIVIYLVNIFPKIYYSQLPVQRTFLIELGKY
jgi:hypothetical protein